jgi:Rap1a immunity proteins
MRAIICSVFLALTVGAANAAESRGSTNYLLPYCRLTPAQTRSEPHQAFMRGQCIRMLETARAMLSTPKIAADKRWVMPGHLCADIPESISPDEAMEVVVRYADLHPEETYRPILSFMQIALSSTWPCRVQFFFPLFPPEIIRER